MTPDEFFIECTTCTARLKVRDLAAIGQIFGCPKCGSMVLVEAPEGIEVPTSDSTSPDEACPESSVPPSAEVDAAHAVNVPAPQAASIWFGAGSLTVLMLVASVGLFACFQWSTIPPDLKPTSPTELVEPVEVTLREDSLHEDSFTEDSKDPEREPEIATKVEPGQLVTDDLQVEEIFDEVDATLASSSAAQLLGANTELISEIAPPLSATDNAETAASQQTALASHSETVDAGATLTNLANLLDENTNSSRQQAEAEATQETEVANSTLASKVALPSSATTLVPQKDVAAQLNAPVFAARFERVSLTEFLRTMSQLSGVPIHLDPQALEQTNNHPNVPVSVSAINQPTLEILQKALKPLNLFPVLERNAVRISSPRLEDHRTVQMSFDVEDLLDGEGRHLDLATLVTTLVDPFMWSTNSTSAKQGNGTVELRRNKLTVSNSRLTTIRTLVLLEKLRAARGLEPRKKVPKKLLALQPRWSQIERYMNRAINLNVWSASPLTHVVRELEEASGLLLLVDWGALSKVGLTPETLATLHTRETMASEVFMNFCDSYDLSVVPVDSRTLQLTTKKAMLSGSYIEFYSIEQLGADGMAKVEELMLNGKAALDPASDFALVAADSETHRLLAR